MGPERGQFGRPSPSRSRGRDDSSVVVLLGDLRARFGRGEPARVEEYLARHPGLADDPEGVLDLIYQEIVLRAEHGEAPRLDEYRRRFPHLSDPLTDLFEVHDALEATDLATPQGTDSGAPTAVASETEPSHPGRRPAADGSWPDLEGYEIHGVLGRGGMGVVYRAFDRRRGSVVALKTMQRVDSETLYRFKQEFRALRDVAHPNLVNLYELVSDGPHWFITMELIEGTTFLDHVRDAPSVATADRSAVESLSTPPATGEPDAIVTGERTARDPALALEPPRRPGDARPPALDSDRLTPEGLRRLRAAVRQLAEGIAALHAAGTMHRDIKPSNVLVEHGGRVVLTDFGLATEPEPADHNRSREGLLVGTAAYMAPEQAEGRPPTPAADWYSVGVVLFEALVGRRPFVGSALQVLMDKQSREPPPPGAIVPEVPADLDALCTALLRRDPDARPCGTEVLARLGAEAAEPPSGSSRPGASSASDVPLIGRAPHRRALDEAFGRVRGGRTVVLGVRGRSGLGKSALVQQFLDDLARREAAVVLAGRCHESESVPYKALDSLIDALTRYLRRLPPSEVDALLPRDVGPLVRVFPVLRRVESIEAAPLRIAEAPDLQELRRRAFEALRELLARLGDRRPLVLAIDDLQWADADSLAAIAEVLRPPDPPVLLLVGCYRSEADAPGRLPAATLVAGGGPDDPVARLELVVDPLEPSEARELALALLDPADPAAGARAEAIARESGGNPLFVAELVRAAQGGGLDNPPSVGDLTLDDVLWSRIARLPEAACRLLEVVAVAGHPVRPELAWRSLGVGGDERGALGVLRAGRLVRGTPGGDPPAVETYHDRVRETILGRLEPGVLRGHHRRLAEALDAAGGAEPEVLGVHFEGAGMLGRAAVHYAAAAARAAEALAFERAAAFYRLALELQPESAEPRARTLRTGLADALANAGRGAEAARAYLSAADGAGDAEAFELRRRAALQYLISGHIDAGLDALRGVLRAVGLRLPETPRRALLSLLLGRARLAVRGLRFQPRDASAVPPAELARIDACWTAGVGLSVVDWIRGADFQARGLRLALRAGEPFRVARALALEAAHSATAGRRAAARTARRLAQADALAGRTGHPYALGMATLARGVSAYLEGRWQDALDGCDAAEALFRDRCTGVAWERDTAHAFALWALSHLGEVAALAGRFPRLQQSARDRGDLYALANLGTYNQSVVRLAADEPEPAREAIREQMAEWSRQGFHVQHNDQLWGAVHIELYRGDGPAAWALIERHWPALARSLLLRVQFVRVSMTALRARAALAAASARSDPGPLVARAARDARRLARERVPWAVAHARLVEGLVEAARGRPEAAARGLADAAARYDDARMALCAAAARRRLGALLGGAEGRSLVEAADARIAAQGVRNPARLAAMYAPGADRWEHI